MVIESEKTKVFLDNGVRLCSHCGRQGKRQWLFGSRGGFQKVERKRARRFCDGRGANTRRFPPRGPPIKGGNEKGSGRREERVRTPSATAPDFVSGRRGAVFSGLAFLLLVGVLGPVVPARAAVTHVLDSSFETKYESAPATFSPVSPRTIAVDVVIGKRLRDQRISRPHHEIRRGRQPVQLLRFGLQHHPYFSVTMSAAT